MKTHDDRELVARNYWVGERLWLTGWSILTITCAWGWGRSGEFAFVMMGMIGVIPIIIVALDMERMSFSHDGVLTVKPFARQSRRYDDVDHVEMQEWVDQRYAGLFTTSQCSPSELHDIPVSDDGYVQHTTQKGKTHRHKVETELVARRRGVPIGLTIVPRGRIAATEIHRQAQQISDFAGLAGPVRRRRFYHITESAGD